MHQSPRVLFISNSSNRSGAPVMLLHLLRWLKHNTDWEIALVVPSAGELLEAFREVVPTTVFRLSLDGSSDFSRVLRRLRRAVGLEAVGYERLARTARSTLPHGTFDAVYCNSIGSANLLRRFGPFSCPVIVHVHEMHYVLQNVWWMRDCLPLAKKYASSFIACSEAVRHNLVDREGVAANEVSVVYEFIDATKFQPPAEGAFRSQMRSSVGLPADAVLVGIVGTVEWRKGSDLLVPLVRSMERLTTERKIAFVWLGGGLSETIEQLRFDLFHAGIQDRVKLVGESDRIVDWMRCIDIFALLSREDPFPLAALEAAAAGVPIVCFQDAGGMPEFVRDDAGVIVPYLDLNAFALAIVDLAGDEGRRKQMGATAATRIRENHDVTVVAPQIVECIQNALSTAALKTTKA